MSPAGIYIHIPFCHKKCGYCDFYSVTRLVDRQPFVDALLREIDLIAANYHGLVADTVYMGGGTPSLLSIRDIRRITEKLQQSFKIDSRAEFTLEANPGTIDVSFLKELHDLGINRLSIGAQSFNEEDLQFLERIHSVKDIYGAVEAGRQAGFDNLNLDLITAFPGLTLNKFKKTLKNAASLRPEHLSCYSLILEEGTPFYSRWENGDFNPPDADRAADFYEMTGDVLSKAGYTAYEISNFCLDVKFRCQHNLKYWNHDTYLGLGPSAHSFHSPFRWKNERSLSKYITILENNQLPVHETEKLPEDTLEFEYIFLHLRLKEGLHGGDYQKRFQKNFADHYSNKISRLIDAGMIEQNGGYFRLSQRGWLLADEVASSF